MILIFFWESENSSIFREIQFQQHLSYVNKIKTKFAFATPLIKSNEEHVSASFYLLRDVTAAEGLEIARNDPYTTGGAWFNANVYDVVGPTGLWGADANPMRINAASEGLDHLDFLFSDGNLHSMNSVPHECLHYSGRLIYRAEFGSCARPRWADFTIASPIEQPLPPVGFAEGHTQRYTAPILVQNWADLDLSH